MNRMHEEIVHLAKRFGTLVQGLPENPASDAETREARRLLYSLDVIITLHWPEEELLSQVEDLPTPA